VAQIQEDMRTLRKESDELKIRCERAEKSAEEYKVNHLKVEWMQNNVRSYPGFNIFILL